MEDKLKEAISSLQNVIIEFGAGNEVISNRRNVIIGVAFGLVALCSCFIMFSVVGSIIGDDKPAAVVDISSLPTFVPKAFIAANSLPATNTPRPTDVSYAPVTPISQYSEGVGLPHPPGDLARVTQIIDGNTIEVEMNGTSYGVRYIGLNTPQQGTPFFQEAANANAALVSGKEVVLVKDVSETDQFDRLLRYVYLTDGTFVNAELVNQGYAEVLEYPPDVFHHEELVQLQQTSQSSGLGIWNLP